MKKLRLYLDTSVWNYVFANEQPEKQKATLEFFELVEKNFYEIFISPVVFDEIDQADALKREQLKSLIQKYKPILLELSEEIISLAHLYISDGIIPEKKIADALHVALTTVYELDALATWNYRHLANLRKKDLILSVNIKQGYLKDIELITPLEVLSSES